MRGQIENRYTPAGLADAIRRLRAGRPGPPTDDDRPAASTFPMTPAAREALRLGRSACGLK